MPDPDNALAEPLAERLRTALIDCASAAFTDAGVRGLCCEGAWEAAVAAMRRLDLETAIAGRDAKSR